MAECVRNYFMLNGELLPTVKFYEEYHPVEYAYEVFRVQEKVPIFVEDHLDRLEETAAISKMTLPVNRVTLLQNIKDTINANPSSPGNIKIVYYEDKSGVSRLFIYFTEHYYPTEEELTQGVPVRLLFGERKNPNAKVMDTFLRSQADEWRDKNNVSEVLLVTHDGFITEGSRSNVFFIRGDEIVTAPPDTVLQGIARKHIIAICKENNIDVKEELVHYTKLERMQAVFLSGTSRRVLPVNRVDHHTFTTAHPMLKQLQGLFEERVKRYIQNFT